MSDRFSAPLPSHAELRAERLRLGVGLTQTLVEMRSEHYKELARQEGTFAVFSMLSGPAYAAQAAYFARRAFQLARNSQDVLTTVGM